MFQSKKRLKTLDDDPKCLTMYNNVEKERGNMWNSLDLLQRSLREKSSNARFLKLKKGPMKGKQERKLMKLKGPCRNMLMCKKYSRP